MLLAAYFPEKEHGHRTGAADLGEVREMNHSAYQVDCAKKTVSSRSAMAIGAGAGSVGDAMAKNQDDFHPHLVRVW